MEELKTPCPASTPYCMNNEGSFTCRRHCSFPRYQQRYINGRIVCNGKYLYPVILVGDFFLLRFYQFTAFKANPEVTLVHQVYFNPDITFSPARKSKMVAAQIRFFFGHLFTICYFQNIRILFFKIPIKNVNNSMAFP